MITGDDCGEDLNGCEANPCSGRNCTDTKAEDLEAGTTLDLYTCSPCPEGYRAETENGKCQG